MIVSYDKLWKLLIDKKINRTELKDLAGISFNRNSSNGQKRICLDGKQLYDMRCTAVRYRRCHGISYLIWRKNC